MTEKVIYRLPSTRLGHQLVSQGWGWAKEQILQERPVIVEFRLETRTDAQNRLLHALFGDTAKQAQWGGKARRPEQWKTLFVSGHAVATQQEIEIVPGLEGEFLNIRESTASMGKRRMASLLEYVMAWCAQNNVELRDARQWLNEGRWA